MELLILIIEDEMLAAEKLVRQLNKIDSEIKVDAIIGSVKDSISYLKENKPDLILADIHLSDGLSLQIFKTIKTPTPVIFTTAYDQYAIEAFKANSIDYLLKPVGKSNLEAALNKFISLRMSRRSTEIDFNQLMDAFKTEQIEYKERFLVRASGTKVRSVSINEIAYFFADGKHTFLITNDHKKYFSDYNITELSSLLDPKYFFKVNRKFIIHIDSIDQMIQYSKSRLKIELSPPSESEVIVSIDRSQDFKKWLGK